MKLHLEVGKVRWWLIGSLAAAFVTGVGLGSTVANMAPRAVLTICKSELPDDLFIPAEQ